MQGLAASSMLSLTVVVVVFLIGMADHSDGRRRVISSSSDEPCKEMTLYLHDILYNGANNSANATSAAATKPTALSTASWKNGTFFGLLVVRAGPEEGGGPKSGAPSPDAQVAHGPLPREVGEGRSKASITQRQPSFLRKRQAFL